MKELEDVFGWTIISISKTLMGSPISLNLRNILWHGFPMLGEIPPELVFTPFYFMQQVFIYLTIIKGFSSKL